MLQQLQLVNQTNASQAEIGTFDFNDRRLPYVGTDQFISNGDALSIDGYGVCEDDFLGHNT